MKRKPSVLLTLTLTILGMAVLCTGASGCSRERSQGKELTEVTLNEVAHSIFYAPQYVAIEEGYFEEEGIDLQLVTGFGADKTMAAVLSGEADIGFMGSEASIYVYSQNPDDYIVNFAQLTQRAGNFLVARTPMENFQWQDLRGKSILGGRKGGMPQMVRLLWKKKAPVMWLRRWEWIPVMYLTQLTVPVQASWNKIRS